MKKRSEGFFGLHFDFHAGPDCTEIGATVTEDMIREIIETLRPDYIQCDCKGHRGYSSYPTKVGNPAPGFAKDALALWREVTRAAGIPLVMHYSGVWDARALELHPEWAATGEDGSRDARMTSTFKGYADGLMIPQLVELANDYGVDAVWVDGECWATVPDFDADVIAQFEAQSGLKLERNSAGAAGAADNADAVGAAGAYDKRTPAYRAFLDFCRRQFFNYLRHYVDEVHAKTRAKNGAFEVASNWAFSSHIPQPVCADVDFLSGDFSSTDSYNSARFEARVLCEQGMPWDLMAWGFYHDFTERSTHPVKGAEALCREAAAVISLGGGFQIYNTQNRDGSARLWETRALAPVARFVREREPFLKGCKPFAEIGVLYSDHDMRNASDTLFYAGGKDPAQGASRLLLDASRPCRVLMDHTLGDAHLRGVKIIILPELRHIAPEIKATLLRFVEDGGSLVLTGAACCKAFEDALGGATISPDSKQRALWMNHNGRQISQYADAAEMTAPDGKNAPHPTTQEPAQTTTQEPAQTTVLATRSLSINGANPSPAVIKTKRGKGSIIAISHSLFASYFAAPDFYVRNMVDDLLAALNPEPFISLSGAKCVDIATTRKDGDDGALQISLTNTSGIYSENRLRAYDEIHPVHDLELRIRTARPASVTQHPENKTPPHTYDAATGILTIRIERLHIHALLRIAT